MNNDTTRATHQNVLQSSPPFFTSIRGALYLLLLSALVPVLLVQAQSLYERFEARRANEFQANVEMSRAVAGTFNGFLQGVLHQEMAIGANLTMGHALSVPEMNQILELNKVDQPAVRNFSWLDPVGRVIASSMGSDIGLDVSDRDHVRPLMRGRDWVVGNLILSRATGEPIFTVGRAIRDKESNLLGMVLAGINPDNLGTVLSLDLAKGGAITILDSQGMAVFQHPNRDWTWEERDLVKGRLSIRRALEGEEVTGIFPCYVTGEERVVALAPIASIGWAAGVGRSKDEVFGPIVSQLIQQLGLFLLFMVAIFLGAFWLSGRIARSFQRLLEQAMALGRGEAGPPIEISGPAELKGLASAFNSMSAKIREREADLKASQMRLHLVLEAIPASVYLQAPDHSIRFANRTFRETFGDPEGKHCYEVLEGKAEPCDVCRMSSPFNSRTCQQGEWTSADGNAYAVHAHPFTERDGSAVVLCLCLDITKRKRAEEALRDTLEEKVSLLKEVHHRVKNNLQIVASLLSLQASEVQDRETVDVLADTENRVRSMALLHEVLYQSPTLARINFADYSDQLCAYLLQSQGSARPRVRLDNRAEAIWLPLEQSVPCGLIMTELVSNALKHGFPDGRTGTVSMGFASANGRMLALTVRDDGVGLPADFDAANPRTLGLNLVSRLAGQLHGKMTIDRTCPAGTQFSVLFPAPKSLTFGELA